ncbi:MAG: molybdenum cofactor biosynthesis protein MoaE [Paracoccaceae bacterium]
MALRVQEVPFDLAAESAAFLTAVGGAGAVVTFTGLVRDNQGVLSGMEIEHYPGMTERAIAGMMGEAEGRWGLLGSLVIHRYGRLGPGEAIMMVATAARHRTEAFQAAEFLMDYLKSRAPFWKKEIGAGGAEWVAAKDADEAALNRW